MTSPSPVTVLLPHPLSNVPGPPPTLSFTPLMLPFAPVLTQVPESDQRLCSPSMAPTLFVRSRTLMSWSALLGSP